jgi:hypothetical protein
VQERHPSALDRFDALAAAAKGKQVAVFLDYDGTLSPIVEDPDRAVMTDEVSGLFFSLPPLTKYRSYYKMGRESRARSASRSRRPRQRDEDSLALTPTML